MNLLSCVRWESGRQLQTEWTLNRRCCKTEWLRRISERKLAFCLRPTFSQSHSLPHSLLKISLCGFPSEQHFLHKTSHTPGWTWTVTKTKIYFVCPAHLQTFEEPVKTLSCTAIYLGKVAHVIRQTDIDNRDLSKQRRLQRQFDKNISHMLCFFWTMTSVLSSSETGASLILL